MSSRKHPPQSYEQRLWRATSAWNSFKHVSHACDYILTEKIDSESPIYYPLATAICVLYARPFKPSKGIESLPAAQFVPKKFWQLHDQLILVRDQTAAHVDARSGLFDGLPANHVQLIVRCGQVAIGFHQVGFNVATISQIRDLANTLIERMRKQVNRVGREYPNERPQDGEYLIDLATGIRPLVAT
jgi:hypothetical protein